MDKRLVFYVCGVYSLLFLVNLPGLEAEENSVLEGVVESRLVLVLKNITDSVENIQKRLHKMRGIMNGTEDTSESSSVEDNVNKPLLNASYDELIERVELARKKVQEMHSILKSVGTKGVELDKNDTQSKNKL